MRQNRVKEIIAILLENEKYISAKELAQRLNVSQRTIYSDLNSSEMLHLLHGAKIVKVPKKGIYLDGSLKQIQSIKFILDNQGDLHFDKFKEDTQKLLILLLTKQTPITLNTVSKYLYRSLNSVMNLIDVTNKEISSFSLIINKKPNYGIWIEGNEVNIQNMFRKICVSINNLESIFPKQIIDTVHQICSHAEILLNTKFTDFDYSDLICRMSILIQRIMNGYHCQKFKNISTSLPEFYISINMKMEIEYNLNINISDDDQSMIAYLLLKTRKTSNQNMNELFNENLVDTFINKISEKLNCSLENDQELKINLLNHLKPAIRRLRYGIPSENPLLDRIRYDYSYIYIAVMMTIDEIETIEKIYFDTNELSYVCLHIVAAMNRKKNHKSLDILLVNNDGISVQTYLKSIIEQHFSELNIDVSDSYSIPNKQYDMVFNSSSQELQINSLKISSEFSQKDLSTIRHWLFTTEFKQFMSIKKKIHEYILLFNDSSSNKIDLLQKYSNYLLETGYVTKDFFDSVIERENHSSTSIGRMVAIPHGSKQTVIKPIIVIIRLNSPISWDDLNVDTIFLTAINEASSKEFSHLFKIIFDLISDEKKLKALKQAKNIDEVEIMLGRQSEIKSNEFN